MKITVTRLCFWADACTINTRLILIHPRAQLDYPLQVHEQKHVEQMREIGAVTFWWRYLTSKAFRQAVEVEAYKAQISAGASAITCARHLATDYRLGITQQQALELLTQ